jgi:demethylmenaquinone methyltransferase/2-methoxy-6-polyprenyl-1,4-benzoquinol methylase
MQQYLQNKKGLVKVYLIKSIDKYDLMNDFMSLGVHRFGKKSNKYDEPILDKN